MRFHKFTHKKARIEIVPMIDTIFFLLVYFMIASLTMSKLPVKDVSLPLSTTAQEHQQDMVVVSLSRSGQCYLDESPIAMKDLRSALTSRLALDTNLAVLINCDKSQPVASFNSVFDLVKQANPVQVMVATTPDANVRSAQ
jgi:biopolymer transport protein ExbD